MGVRLACEEDRARVRAQYLSFGQREWERFERPAEGAVDFAVTLVALNRHLAAIATGIGRHLAYVARR